MGKNCLILTDALCRADCSDVHFYANPIRSLPTEQSNSKLARLAGYAQCAYYCGLSNPGRQMSLRDRLSAALMTGKNASNTSTQTRITCRVASPVALPARERLRRCSWLSRLLLSAFHSAGGRLCRINVSDTVLMCAHCQIHSTAAGIAVAAGTACYW